jgi:hypothetical protein
MKILDEDGLLDEFIQIASISKTRIDEWNTRSLTTFERWSEIFEFMGSECILLRNTQLTNSMDLSASSEAASFAATEEFLSILWNPKVH